MTEAAQPGPKNLPELEAALREHSHGDEALRILRGFADRQGNTSARQLVFARQGALVRPPIQYGDALAVGAITDVPDDVFVVLQGDVVQTEAAYFMGERIQGGARLAVATSTCDLLPGRREFAALLRVRPVSRDDEGASNAVAALLKFSSTRAMYLPRLLDDEPDVIANVVSFDGLAMIRSDDLLLSRRLSSLSLVGWRVFGSLVRGVLVRSTPGETTLRTSFT